MTKEEFINLAAKRGYNEQKDFMNHELPDLVENKTIQDIADRVYLKDWDLLADDAKNLWFSIVKSVVSDFAIFELNFQQNEEENKNEIKN